MSAPPNPTRYDHDLLGAVEVPAEALHGAQTQRALRNFPVNSQKTLGGYPRLVEGLMYVKQAAAKANASGGYLPPEKGEAIVRAAQWILEEGRFDLFPIHALHGGGGTSANMNANEVLANIGEELLGGRRGGYALLDPNDHVNLHQSTNDVYPTACHIAVLLEWPVLERALVALAHTFQQRARELANEVRLARTCLQDAVDTTFGDLLLGYASFVDRARGRIAVAVDSLHEVPLGGSIVGRSCDVPPDYLGQVVPSLREVTADAAYRQSSNLFDAAQNADPMVAVSAQLDLLARGLLKIGQDFRLLGSGPEGGLNEIALPAVQPGSSIMPGKVNPVIPEFLMQMSFQVIGAHAAALATLDHGELDLNIWESTQVINVLEVLRWSADGVTAFEGKCVRAFQVRSDVNQGHAHSLIPLLARLARTHGYSRISALCEEAGNSPDRIRELLRERGLTP